MGDITFVKTRYQDKIVHIDANGVEFKGYGSYRDYWRLVELAGYDVCYVDEIDAYDPTKTYIITPLNDEWLAGWPNATAQIIHHELEWRWDERANWQEPPGVSRVWHIDKWFADKFGFEYVPVGSDERLNELGTNYPAQNRYDVAILSYQTPRRQMITSQLENRGLRLAPISGVWGRMRSDVLLSSHVMVHTHQNDNMPGIASLRWAVAAAHKLPMITETVKDRGIYTYSYMTQADYNFLAEFTVHMLRDKPKLADYGLSLHNLLCRDYTFRKMVEKNV